MTLRFGTDGVRGVANSELTPELALALGRAAARVLDARRIGRVVIGRDTRRSGPLLEAALAAGFAAEGVDVEVLGVAPTPAVAWVAAADGTPGVVVSASHNPFPDNGVKLFAPGGLKLTDATEAALEAELDAILGAGARPDPDAPTGARVGTIARGTGALARYAAAVQRSLDGRRLDGTRLIVDCAHGAASAVAPDVLRALGAEVTVIHASPDGRNINEGAGSTDPDELRRAVLDQGADAGVAFDGDADRMLAVDGRGRLVDGDQILAVCAIDRHDRASLPGDTVVVTVMANLGLRRALAERGVGVVETQVGDRNVLEALDRGGWSLGGEQSGHLIFRDLATTGDGLLTAVQLLDAVRRDGRPLADLVDASMTRLPQVLRNVRVGRVDPGIVAAVRADVEAVEHRLADRGRVLVRASGTEPVVRVMVEADDAAVAEEATAELVRAVERAAGAAAGPRP